MSHHPVYAKVSNLRQRSIVETLEALLVVFGAVIGIAIVPTLLLRYFYDTSTLLEQPKLLEYLPVALTLIAGFYLVKALFNNFRHERQIKQLLTELEAMDDCCGNCCGNSGADKADKAGRAEEADEDWDEDLKELEELLAEVETEEKSTKKAPATKGAVKKVVKAKALKVSKKAPTKRATKK